MNIKHTPLLFLLLAFQPLYAQIDTAKSIDLQEVVVTATRTEKTLSAVPMPVTLISQKQIQQMGSLRLGEVLQEQTGLAIQSNHGSGLQMQGMNPDYTLILIDGQPLIGRTAGTLELSRLAVGNIKQIEVVKGPSSSLYGSEALAGVVNIITEKPTNNRVSISARYGANRTSDFGLNASVHHKKISNSIFINRYASNGYDFSPNTFGKTVEPFNNYTFQHKLIYDFSKKIKLTIASRFFTENQESNFDVGTNTNAILVSGTGKITDFNLSPTIDFNISKKIKTKLFLYHTFYKTKSNVNYLSNNELLDESFFQQNFFRPEIQTEYTLSSQHIFTFGGGKTWENVKATRYEGTKYFTTNYAFAQYDFLPTERLNFILGGRLDQHTVYGTQFSPKFSTQYDITSKIALRASVGTGFKAPDFRQLYLNFNNNVAGYSVFGTQEIANILSDLQAQNQIADILFSTEKLSNLQPEKSLAFNIGAKVKAKENLDINLNIFRNDIHNLIETQTIARRTNGQSIFSYMNLNQVFTQGLELDFALKLNKNLCLSGGYQYLEAKDKNVIEQLKNGEIFSRDATTLETKRLKTSDYGGLFGRSRNMLNVKLFYENTAKGFSVNWRTIYRGKYGLGDKNGNLILDDTSEYVDGYFTSNISASKYLAKEKLKVQAGIDNLFNYRDKLNIPTLAGRLWYLSIHVQLYK